MDFSQNRKEVIFEPIEHTYTHVKSGKKFISASQLIHKYCPPFDPDGSILKKCALKRGISEAELKKEWDDKRDKSCIIGTTIHSEIEFFIKNKKIRDSEYKHFVQQFSKIKFNGKMHSEVLLYSEEYGVAGTSDLIYEIDKDTISCIDFKSNERITKQSYWKKEYMLYPLRHLENLNFYHYEMQLSLYCYLLDLQGCWVDSLRLFHFDKSKKELVQYDLQYRRNDVVNMLEHYKKSLKI